MIDEKGLSAAIDAIWRQWKLPEEERLNGATTAPALARAAILAYEAAKPKEAEGLKLGSRLTVEGVEAVVVSKAALDWLNGEGDDFERPEGVRGAFWWRSEFRRRTMLSAAGDNDAAI